ncbi:hypothetical protein PTTG_25886 [Puccinia triticina 1-1 BBBD Race 1]|uniref:hAT-like transposase RNase-H fold domain-containing protein n=1 Tax=Puccinia triticina (isolate 1-1 / race 1 (BBBD)) TaxID=630390 RepID=A0A180H0T2_PUCT1|nr:hypothetical protein PTTG_25886 [Puccinia triticina 1-1 BBBD Race 1]
MASTPSSTRNRTGTTRSNNPPQSARRESSRIRTPSTQPGYVPTQRDSRRSLVSPAPTRQQGSNKTSKKRKLTISSESNEETDHDDSNPSKQKDATATNPLARIKQVSSRTGEEVLVNTAKDSEGENRKKSVNSQKKKDLVIQIRNPERLPGHVYGVPANSRYWEACIIMKSHCNGAKIKGALRSACLGRSKAIKSGSKLPPTAAEASSKIAENFPSGNSTLVGYATKGQFNNKTLNKLIVIWIVRHLLPWIQIEDFLLRVAFDFLVCNSELHSWVWAATHAHQLYLKQRIQVLDEIKKSNSQICLALDVWTTKGSHKAFVGITCFFINEDWKYVCQHLTIKYVLWHHNGKYLAAPFANVLTTDSGINNFTMATGVASIFGLVDSIYWDVENNHHRCICHVIALILGAGLNTLNLSKAMVCKQTDDQSFPTLETIAEEVEELIDEEIVEVNTEISEDEEDLKYTSNSLNPDNAEPEEQEPGWENKSDNEEELNGDLSGIGFTLKKIDYICRRIASSPQKQAEWKLWADRLGYKGPGVIGGYGIRWIIAYNSQQRAYQGRWVIKQLLDNESDRHNGCSASKHFYKSYKLTTNKWEDINNLNMILKDFLEMTKRMEGDGPKLAMVLYEYSRVLDTLKKKKLASTTNKTKLQQIFAPMIKITKKYVNIALKCDTVIVATFLHPAWWMMLFQSRFGSHVRRINGLIQVKFKERKNLLKSLRDNSPQPQAK